MQFSNNCLRWGKRNWECFRYSAPIFTVYRERPRVFSACASPSRFPWLCLSLPTPQSLTCGTCSDSRATSSPSPSPRCRTSLSWSERRTDGRTSGRPRRLPPDEPAATTDQLPPPAVSTSRRERLLSPRPRQSGEPRPSGRDGGRWIDSWYSWTRSVRRWNGRTVAARTLPVDAIAAVGEPGRLGRRGSRRRTGGAMTSAWSGY